MNKRFGAGSVFPSIAHEAFSPRIRLRCSSFKKRFRLLADAPRDCPLLLSGCDEEHHLSGFSGVSAHAANGPWPRKATKRTFLVAEVTGIMQEFAAVSRSDSMNLAAHDPGASRQIANDLISIS